MHTLYFTDRTIVIDGDASKYAPHEMERVSPGDPALQKTKVLQKVQNTKRRVLIAEDPDAVYRAIADQFPSIEAGGGLVENGRGEILMIFRHHRWDLPKGKLEPGESIGDCAVREVEEETGLRAPVRGKKLLVTNHFYRMDGEWVMKRTTWYRMSHPGDGPLVPQAEEDITAIGWVNPSKLDGYLWRSYPTIVDVFEAAGYRIR